MEKDVFISEYIVDYWEDKLEDNNPSYDIYDHCNKVDIESIKHKDLFLYKNSSNLITTNVAVINKEDVFNTYINTKNKLKMRDIDISRLWYVDGFTYQSIGNTYNLTKERIRQILNKTGVINLPIPEQESKEFYLHKIASMVNSYMYSISDIKKIIYKDKLSLKFGLSTKNTKHNFNNIFNTSISNMFRERNILFGNIVCKCGTYSDYNTNTGTSYALCKQCMSDKMNKHRRSNCEVRWRFKNKEKVKITNKKYRNKPLNKIQQDMRGFLKRLENPKYSNNIHEVQMVLGYTRFDLVQHIESQFEDWMTWENRGHGEGTWQIDHIVPVSYLVKRGVTDPATINCLQNLKPLCSIKNRQKWDSITKEGLYLIENGIFGKIS